MPAAPEVLIAKAPVALGIWEGPQILRVSVLLLGPRALPRWTMLSGCLFQQVKLPTGPLPCWVS